MFFHFQPFREKLRALFSALVACGMFASSVLAEPAAEVPSEADREEDEAPRIKITGWRFVNVFQENAADLRDPESRPAAEVAEDPHASQGDLDQARKVVAEQVRKLQGEPGNLKHVGEIFVKHPFEAIEKIAKAKEIPEPVSRKLSEARRSMIDQAMAGVLEKIDPGGRLTIGMLDSGNKNSGIASDVDQTLFLVPREALNEVLRERNLSESGLIDEVIRTFNTEFERIHDCAPERLGIESMNGADFFPDWRANQTTGTLSMEADRVVGRKRDNPEAYRSEGQLKSQAEGRGYEALREHSQRVAELDQLKESLEGIEASVKPEAERAGERKRLTDEFVRECQSRGFRGNSVAALEAEFERLSPWTEVGWDHGSAPPKTRTARLVDTRQKVLKLKPELAKRFAFDGAWDNWLMFEHHPHNQKKYLLRSVAEGIGLTRQLKPGEKLSTFEFEKHYARHYREGSLKELDGFLRDVYGTEKPGMPEKAEEKRLERLRRVLAVASRDRLRHKGEGPFKSFDDHQIFAEYVTEISDRDRRDYADNPEALENLKQLRLEAAKRAWELEARALMVENLVRTIQAPGDLISGGLSDREFAELKRRYPHATKEKLAAAVEKSLYHGLQDLMSPELAKALVKGQPWTRSEIDARYYGDMAYRVLQEVRKTGDPRLIERVGRIAQEAAVARLSSEPEAKLNKGLKERFRNAAFYKHVHQSLKTRLESSKQVYRDTLEGIKSGKYSKEYVAERMFEMSMERVVSSIAEVGDAVGFNIKDIHKYTTVYGQKKLPTFEIELEGKPFNARKMMANLVSSKGNVDSALQIMLAYQTGGSEAAAWAAARELVMNIPGISQGAAVYDLVVHGRPEGVIMAGAAMYIPGVGQAYLVVSIATTSVTLVGNYLLEPLKDDLADMAYQGFLEKQAAGLFRAGIKGLEASRRYSMLHFVPVRAIPETVKLPDGKESLTLHVARYSKEEAFDLDFISTITNDEYEFLIKEGLVGGGKRWDTLLKQTRKDLRLAFEAKRMSLFYHCRDRVEKCLKKETGDEDLYLYDREKAFPHLVKLFRQDVDNWIEAKGDFAQFPENVIKKHRFTDAIRTKLAVRMVQDFLRSSEILRHGEHSKENEIRMRCEQALQDRRAFEANQMMVALDDARAGSADQGMLRAIRLVHNARKDAARAPSPRIHVRPRVVTEMTSPREAKESVDLLVSVVACPEDHPPPYRIVQESAVARKHVSELDEARNVMTCTVTVFDGNGKPVGETWTRDVGVVTGPEEEAEEEPQTPASVAIEGMKLRGKYGNAPVMTTGEAREVSQGHVYESQWLRLGATYSVAKEGTGLKPAFYKKEDGKYTIGLLRREGYDYYEGTDGNLLAKHLEYNHTRVGHRPGGSFSEVGKHELKGLIGPHLRRGETAECGVILFGWQPDADGEGGKLIELTRKSMNVRAYPKGWALTKILSEPGKGVSQKKFSAEVKGCRISLSRTYGKTKSWNRSKYEVSANERIAFALPPIVTDGDIFPVAVKRSVKRTAKPISGEGGTIPPEKLERLVDWGTMSLDFTESKYPPYVEAVDSKGKELGTIYSTEDLSPQGSAAKPKAQLHLLGKGGVSSKTTPHFDLKFVFEAGGNGAYTVAFRYSRLDQNQAVKPLAGEGDLPAGEDAGEDGLLAALQDAAGDRPSDDIVERSRAGADDAAGTREGSEGTEAAEAILSSANPWRHPRVQALIAEWLRDARPVLEPVEGTQWRYDEWGRAWNGLSVRRLSQPPTTDKERLQYLWDASGRLTSRAHSNLRNYIETRLRGGGPPSAGDNPFEVAVSRGLDGQAGGGESAGLTEANPFEEAAANVLGGRADEGDGQDAASGNPFEEAASDSLGAGQEEREGETTSGSRDPFEEAASNIPVTGGGDGDGATGDPDPGAFEDRAARGFGTQTSGTGGGTAGTPSNSTGRDTGTGTDPAVDTPDTPRVETRDPFVGKWRGKGYSAMWGEHKDTGKHVPTGKTRFSGEFEVTKAGTGYRLRMHKGPFEILNPSRNPLETGVALKQSGNTFSWSDATRGVMKGRGGRPDTRYDRKVALKIELTAQKRMRLDYKAIVHSWDARKAGPAPGVKPLWETWEFELSRIEPKK